MESGSEGGGGDGDLQIGALSFPITADLTPLEASLERGQSLTQQYISNIQQMLDSAGPRLSRLESSTAELASKQLGNLQGRPDFKGTQAEISDAMRQISAFMGVDISALMAREGVAVQGAAAATRSRAEAIREATSLTANASRETERFIQLQNEQHAIEARGSPVRLQELARQLREPVAPNQISVVPQTGQGLDPQGRSVDAYIARLQALRSTVSLLGQPTQVTPQNREQVFGVQAGVNRLIEDQRTLQRELNAAGLAALAQERALQALQERSEPAAISARTLAASLREINEVRIGGETFQQNSRNRNDLIALTIATRLQVDAQRALQQSYEDTATAAARAQRSTPQAVQAQIDYTTRTGFLSAPPPEVTNADPQGPIDPHAPTPAPSGPTQPEPGAPADQRVGADTRAAIEEFRTFVSQVRQAVTSARATPQSADETPSRRVTDGQESAHQPAPQSAHAPAPEVIIQPTLQERETRAPHEVQAEIAESQRNATQTALLSQLAASVSHVGSATESVAQHQHIEDAQTAPTVVVPNAVVPGAVRPAPISDLPNALGESLLPAEQRVRQPRRRRQRVETAIEPEDDITAYFRTGQVNPEATIPSTGERVGEHAQVLERIQRLQEFRGREGPLSIGARYPGARFIATPPAIEEQAEIAQRYGPRPSPLRPLPAQPRVSNDEDILRRNAEYERAVRAGAVVRPAPARTPPNQVAAQQAFQAYYHGGTSEITALDPERMRGANLFGRATYLTNDPRIAGGVVDQTGNLVSRGYAQARLPDENEINTRTARAAASRARAARLRSGEEQLSTGARGTPEDWARSEEGAAEYDEGRVGELRALQNTPVGPNVTRFRVPTNFRALDLREDQELPPHVVEAAEQRFPDHGVRHRLTGLRGQEAYKRLSGLFESEIDPAAEFGPPEDRPVEETGRRTTQFLEGLGYQGIRHTGGINRPIADEAGQEIRHESLAVFPSAAHLIRPAYVAADQPAPVRVSPAVTAAETAQATPQPTTTGQSRPSQRTQRSQRPLQAATETEATAASETPTVQTQRRRAQTRQSPPEQAVTRAVPTAPIVDTRPAAIAGQSAAIQSTTQQVRSAERSIADSERRSASAAQQGAIRWEEHVGSNGETFKVPRYGPAPEQAAPAPQQGSRVGRFLRDEQGAVPADRDPLLLLLSAPARAANAIRRTQPEPQREPRDPGFEQLNRHVRPIEPGQVPQGAVVTIAGQQYDATPESTPTLLQRARQVNQINLRNQQAQNIFNRVGTPQEQPEDRSPQTMRNLGQETDETANRARKLFGVFDTTRQTIVRAGAALFGVQFGLNLAVGVVRDFRQYIADTVNSEVALEQQVRRVNVLYSQRTTTGAGAATAAASVAATAAQGQGTTAAPAAASGLATQADLPQPEQQATPTGSPVVDYVRERARQIALTPGSTSSTEQITSIIAANNDLTRTAGLSVEQVTQLAEAANNLARIHGGTASQIADQLRRGVLEGGNALQQFNIDLRDSVVNAQTAGQGYDNASRQARNLATILQDTHAQIGNVSAAPTDSGDQLLNVRQQRETEQQGRREAVQAALRGPAILKENAELAIEHFGDSIGQGISNIFNGTNTQAAQEHNQQQLDAFTQSLANLGYVTESGGTIRNTETQEILRGADAYAIKEQAANAAAQATTQTVQASQEAVQAQQAEAQAAQAAAAQEQSAADQRVAAIRAIADARQVALQRSAEVQQQEQQATGIGASIVGPRGILAVTPDQGQLIGQQQATQRALAVERVDTSVTAAQQNDFIAGIRQNVQAGTATPLQQRQLTEFDRAAPLETALNVGLPQARTEIQRSESQAQNDLTRIQGQQQIRALDVHPEQIDAQRQLLQLQQTEGPLRLQLEQIENRITLIRQNNLDLQRQELEAERQAIPLRNAVAEAQRNIDNQVNLELQARQRIAQQQAQAAALAPQREVQNLDRGIQRDVLQAQVLGVKAIQGQAPPDQAEQFVALSQDIYRRQLARPQAELNQFDAESNTIETQRAIEDTQAATEARQAPYVIQQARAQTALRPAEQAVQVAQEQRAVEANQIELQVLGEEPGRRAVSNQLLDVAQRMHGEQEVQAAIQRQLDLRNLEDAAATDAAQRRLVESQIASADADELDRILTDAVNQTDHFRDSLSSANGYMESIAQLLANMPGFPEFPHQPTADEGKQRVGTGIDTPKSPDQPPAPIAPPPPEPALPVASAPALPTAQADQAARDALPTVPLASTTPAPRAATLVPADAADRLTRGGPVTPTSNIAAGALSFALPAPYVAVPQVGATASQNVRDVRPSTSGNQPSVDAPVNITGPVTFNSLEDIQRYASDIAGRGADQIYQNMLKTLTGAFNQSRSGPPGSLSVAGRSNS